MLGLKKALFDIADGTSLVFERRDHGVNFRCRADIVARLKIRIWRRQPIQPVNFCPGVIPSEASAHGSNIDMAVADRETASRKRLCLRAVTRTRSLGA